MNNPLNTPHVHHAVTEQLRSATALVKTDAHAQIQLTGLAEFNDRAGVPMESKREVAHRSLQNRLAPVVQRRNAQRSGSSMHKADPLEQVAEEALSILREQGKSSLDAYLQQNYDPLQGYTLLQEMLGQLDEQALPQTDKDRLKGNLDELMSDLQSRHGEAIQRGLQDGQAFEAALGKMGDLARQAGKDPHSQSLIEMRSMFGAKSSGNMEAPLTPLALAKSLQEKFGPDNFTHALGNARAQMARDLRSNPDRGPGPRLWLSLSDAAAFNAVQTSFALAGDLRRALPQLAGVVPLSSQAQAAIALLAATEGGKADRLLDQVINRPNDDTVRQPQVYALLRNAMDRLPFTLWPSDARRMELLDELRALMYGASKNASPGTSKADQLEDRLRDKVQGRKKRDQDQQGQGHQDDEDDEKRTKMEE